MKVLRVNYNHARTFFPLCIADTIVIPLPTLSGEQRFGFASADNMMEEEEQALWEVTRGHPLNRFTFLLRATHWCNGLQDDHPSYVLSEEEQLEMMVYLEEQLMKDLQEEGSTYTYSLCSFDVS